MSDARPPNILLIISDEHNAGITGCYGSPIVRTPHLDRLAAAGVTFDACYCNSPLCTPSRLSMLTGRYVSHIDAWTNRFGAWSDNPLLGETDYQTLYRRMNAAGHESLVCGRVNYDNTARYGAPQVGPGRFNQHDAGANREAAIAVDRRLPADFVPDDRKSPRLENMAPGWNARNEYDQEVSARAGDFLRQRKAADRPFFLSVGYMSPHPPSVVPEEYWNFYKGRVPMPVIPEGHLESLPRNYQGLRSGFGLRNVSPEAVRRCRELYYAHVQWIDEEIGKVLDALEASDAADNTLVIYTSDHGENMGEHGLWNKAAMYEHAARVPLIVSWPSRWQGGQRRTQACSLVDVSATILEVGGAKAPASWDGDSMLTWLDDPAAAWKDCAVSEYYGQYITSGYAMLRQGRYKYVYHAAPDEQHEAQRELYDLDKDLGEFVNLADQPHQRERVAQMHARLLQELGEQVQSTEVRYRRQYEAGVERAKQAANVSP